MDSTGHIPTLYEQDTTIIAKISLKCHLKQHTLNDTYKIAYDTDSVCR